MSPRGDLFVGFRLPGRGRKVDSEVLIGDTISGTTTVGKLMHIGPAFNIHGLLKAKYATLMVDGPTGGGLYFGRSHAVGTHLLTCVTGASGELIGDSYTFDNVDVTAIAIQDNGTATNFTIDYTGP